MLPNKRNRKPPKKFVPSYPVKGDKSKQADEFLSERFEYIPFPSKYDEIEDIFVLYASLSLSRHENRIFCDFALLNTFYTFSGIEVNNLENGKLIIIKCEKKAYTRFNRWATVINKMNSTKDAQLKEGISLVKEYSRVFEKLMNRKMKETEKALKEVESEAFIMEQARLKQKSLDQFRNLPCIEFKSHFTGHQERLIEISLNEKLINILRYDIDSFISNVLREGFPSILFRNSSELGSPDLIQKILKDYISAKNLEYQSSELECRFITKNGYLRDSRARISIGSFYENGRYEVNTVITVLDEFVLPKFILENYRLFDYNKEFLDLMSTRESETAYFLKEYYDHVIHKKYSNFSKICKIKELDYKLEIE